MNCLFTSDLHGKPERYDALFGRIIETRPRAVFLGGDLVGGALHQRRGTDPAVFLDTIIFSGLRRVKTDLGAEMPKIFVIMGNDDPKVLEPLFFHAETGGLWTYIHNRNIFWEGFSIYGYACVPPSPFRLKDWERYDVSRFVDVGCIPPEEGYHTVPGEPETLRFATMKDDIEALTGDNDLSKAIMLFHAPPYQTGLDRAALDGMMVDHAPVDVHVGSIAVRDFILAHKPMLTLHGHVHETTRLTGIFKEKLAGTWAFAGAHDGPELAVIEWEADNPGAAVRTLIGVD